MEKRGKFGYRNTRLSLAKCYLSSLSRVECYYLVGSVCRMNELNPRQARSVLGWVTVFGWGR